MLIVWFDCYLPEPANNFVPFFGCVCSKVGMYMYSRTSPGSTPSYSIVPGHGLLVLVTLVLFLFWWGLDRFGPRRMFLSIVLLDRCVVWTSSTQLWTFWPTKGLLQEHVCCIFRAASSGMCVLQNFISSKDGPIKGTRAVLLYYKTMVEKNDN